MSKPDKFFVLSHNRTLVDFNPKNYMQEKQSSKEMIMSKF